MVGNRAVGLRQWWGWTVWPPGALPRGPSILQDVPEVRTDCSLLCLPKPSPNLEQVVGPCSASVVCDWQQVFLEASSGPGLAAISREGHLHPELVWGREVRGRQLGDPGSRKLTWSECSRGRGARYPWGGGQAPGHSMACLDRRRWGQALGEGWAAPPVWS